MKTATTRDHGDGDDGSDGARPRLGTMKKSCRSSNTTRRSVSFAEPASEEMRPHQHDDTDDEDEDDGLGVLRFLHTRY